MCELPLAIRVDGDPQPSYTTFLRPCAYAAVLDTKIIGSALRVHLSSDYSGDPERPARSSHVAHAVGAAPGLTAWRAIEHAPGELDVRWSPSLCLYDHMFRIIDLLERLGHAAEVELGADALKPFEALARGATVAAGRPGRLPRSDVAALLGSWGLFGSPGQRHAQAQRGALARRGAKL
jgi:hypothetical protein